MDYLKEAFQKVKEDVLSLRKDIEVLNFTVEEFNRSLEEIRETVSLLKKDLSSMHELKEDISHLKEGLSTAKDDIPTTSTHSPTDNLSFTSLKDQILPISTGNEGVQTDRQTDRQTDIPTQNLVSPPPKLFLDSSTDSINNAANILSSLDNLKKEIRLKFKRLTEREWLVFSTIYQLDEENGFSDYKAIAERLNLSESSIRDYVGGILSKGIPVEKQRVNNKTIHLKISENLKKIATLPTILQLRGL